VLVVGGSSGGVESWLASAEVFDGSNNTWRTVGSMSEGRGNITATLLRSGSVVVAGGDSTISVATAEVYDPETEGWTSTDRMDEPRSQYATVLLEDGKLLLTGGVDTDSLATTLLYSSR